MKRPFFLICALCAFLLAGCTTPNQNMGGKPGSAGTYSNVVFSSNVQPSAIQSPQAITYHIVRPKETLWRISKRYGVPVQSIMDANNITDHTQLKIGQKLQIPGAPPVKTSIPLYSNKNRWQYIVVHHTATAQGDGHSINQLHLRRGWKNGLGYHFLVDNGTMGHGDGEIEVGHRWKKQMDGAHANKANMNHIGIGIALVGNFSEKPVSESQLRSLAYLVRTLQKHYRIPDYRVLPHGGVPGAATECPGKYFPWSRFKEMIEED